MRRRRDDKIEEPPPELKKTAVSYNKAGAYAAGSPFGRGLPPVPSTSVPFLITRILSGGELMVVPKKSVRNLLPAAPYVKLRSRWCRR
jgi:hypothetical protein